MISYLPLLTTHLNKAKKEYAKSKNRFEDRDFIQDLIQQASQNLSRKDRSWEPVLEVLKRCVELTWPETCLQILRQLHISATAQELVDNFKSYKQSASVGVEEYILLMQARAKGLSGILKRRDAMRHTVENLSETRIQKPLEKLILEGTITSFADLYNHAVDLHERYVGSLARSSPAREKNASRAPATKHQVNIVGSGTAPQDSPSEEDSDRSVSPSHDSQLTRVVYWYEDGSSYHVPAKPSSPTATPAQGQEPTKILTRQAGQTSGPNQVSRQQKQVNPQQPQTKTHQPRESKPRTCFNCGSPDHWRDSCPHPQKEKSQDHQNQVSIQKQFDQEMSRPLAA